MKRENYKWYILLILGLVISNKLNTIGGLENQFVNIMVGLILSIPIEILLYKSSKDEELSEKKRYIAKLGFNFYIFVVACSVVLELIV